jgi:hypothetical protein
MPPRWAATLHRGGDGSRRAPRERITLPPRVFRSARLLPELGKTEGETKPIRSSSLYLLDIATRKAYLLDLDHTTRWRESHRLVGRDSCC